MNPAMAMDALDTPPKLFRARCREWGGAPALRAKRRGLWSGVDWATYYAHARAVGLALGAVGLRRGDRVSVLADNRPEWLYVDVGAQCMGFVGNGIYPTSSPEQVAHILADSGSAVLVVENQEQLDKALAVRERCPALRHVVVIEREGLRGFADPAVSFFDDLLARGFELARTRSADFEAAIDASRPDDVAFLVYTSGTTGAPKGAMISAANVVTQIAQAPNYLHAGFGDRTLSFLPLCHIAERMASVFNPLALGLVVHFPENAGTVFNDLREVEPHVVFAPPRFWEKLHSGVELALRDAIAPARWVYAKARASAQSRYEAMLQQRGPVRPPTLSERLLEAAAFRNVRRFLGLSRVKTALTGAAPVPPDLVRWYLALGIELREAFGMTETCGFVTATPPGCIRLGWAGVPGPGIEIRLGAENELLVRGPNVFAGYWGQPDKTAEAIDADGWLHTGDCAEIAPTGELAIRDRLKDILITSGGKNVTPSQIENLLKFSPYITDAVAVGDGRRYITALVMLDHEQVARFARDRQVPYTDYASLVRAPEVVALVRDEIERANARLARVEQVKDFRIIDQLLTAEDEELTPTMKLKRKLVVRKYAALIDEMYPD
ncbi:AMP-dependent synthetase/ligase [Azohydromonas sediminis]|uniref:AMP-dependent synthetase/ligase n=1 Tax=Azohydromonas sediminis TaxID=2259674 RepID=UPI000E65AE34|nr:long-chain fatty acid--CoA ligase [Azohydromonas sediminis]